VVLFIKRGESLFQGEEQEAALRKVCITQLKIVLRQKKKSIP
jgi:hypothetical protein